MPESVAAVLDFGEVVEGAAGGEKATLLVVGPDASEEVGEGLERLIASLGDDSLSGGFPESFEPVEAEAEVGLGLWIF